MLERKPRLLGTSGQQTCVAIMERELDKGFRDTFSFEMSQIEPATFLQLQGTIIDKEKQQETLTSIEEKFEVLRAELSEALGQNVIFHSSEGAGLNINSPQQLQKLLYIDMGLPAQHKRRQSRFDPKKLTADEEALEKLGRITDNPILQKIIEAKKLAKLKTFISIDISPANKVHTSYNITGATMSREKKGLIIDDESQYRSFGRWSSSKSIILPYGSGNHQNIPYEARKMYVPPPGYEIIQADYVQAEAVVVAYEIRDIKLTRMFKDSFGLSPRERKKKGFDVHRLTASSMFGIPLEEVTDEQRKVGKTLRHATNYSAGPAVLMRKLGVSMKEAKYLLQMFFQGTPQLPLWHRVIQQQLRDNGRVLTNLLGRAHKFLDRWPAPGQDGTLFRSAYSFKPQSTVGDLLNTALVCFYSQYGEGRSLALQLHDAIYVYSPLGMDNRLLTLSMLWNCMKIELCSSYGDKYFIDVDFSAGPSWGETKEIDIGTKQIEEMQSCLL
jgi:DNA polymerase-1